MTPRKSNLFELTEADRSAAADLIKHLAVLRKEIKKLVATTNHGLDHLDRDHLVQTATIIVAGWYNSGQE